MSRTPIYNTWGNIIQRCESELPFYRKYYGDRGIKVCTRWRNSFPNFFADMGHAPSKKHTLERIDNNGNYSPKNCKWATRKEQSNNTRWNKRITFQNKTLTLSQWAEQINIHPVTLSLRFRNGWSVKRALTEPLHKNMSRRR